MIGQQTRTRISSPARWQKAAERAVAEGIQIRQLAGCGAWIASSGSDATVAYEVEVTGNIAHGCSCLAGLNDDPVCKHRAAFFLLIGALSLDPEPDPPAPATEVTCWACFGGGVIYDRELERLGFLYPRCQVCNGTGRAPLAAQAVALVAAAEAAEGRVAAIAEPEPAPFDAAPVAGVAFVGRAGHVAGYDVLIVDDTLLVTHAATGAEWRHVVPCYGTALSDLVKAPGLRLGWARFPDDAEAIYCYDTDDGNFGYALNLSDPALSEWGYAPFLTGEDADCCDDCGGPLDDDAVTDDALQTVCAACHERQQQDTWNTLRAIISADHANDAWERAQRAA